MFTERFIYIIINYLDEFDTCRRFLLFNAICYSISYVHDIFDKANINDYLWWFLDYYFIATTTTSTTTAMSVTADLDEVTAAVPGTQIKCGLSKYPDAGGPHLTQIVGGRTSRPNEFPWQVKNLFIILSHLLKTHRN
jgi:hypothetical protein